jgi:peptide/nickel transport system substrate-binding protein
VLSKIGFNVDMQAMDWPTVVARRASKEPLDKGGWNVFYTYLGGFGNVSPAPNIAIRGNGEKAWFGWPTNPKMEEYIDAWYDAPNLAAQKKICDDMQVLFWQDPPYVPMGMYDQPTAFNKRITDVPEGWPQFYGLKKNS